MTDATLSFLLENVKQLLTQKFDLIKEASSELEQLKNDLQIMKAFLDDNASKKAKSKNFKAWERQIREVVYKVEDAIDEYVSNAASKKGWAKKLDLAETVRSLREKDVKIVFDIARADFANLPAPEDADKEPRAAVDRIRAHEPITDKTIVGFEDAIEELIENLQRPSSELEAISITGMPGLGKTTVASKIYYDSRIDFEFPIRIWINVSEEYVSRDFYLTILNKFTNHDMSGMSDTELIEKVREYLSQVKFLLVADDVWTPDAWKAIKVALPHDKTRGKVLITSRNESVASFANPTEAPHKLRFLDFEESWKLLQLEVYGKEGAWPKDLEDIGKVIAENCDGLPFSVVVAGGILLDNISDSISDRRTEWKKVANKVYEYLLEEYEVGKLVKFIYLSYDKLPYSLRPCFLYVGTFPEAYDISAWKLIRLWIAEGFITEKIGLDQSMEDVAEENLNELIKRNLVMVVKKNGRGQAKTLRVHDLIRQFCKKEAEELNLFREIRLSTSQGIFLPPVSDIKNFRRICLHSSVLHFFSKKPDCSKIRSFICFSKEGVNVPLANLSKVIDPFKMIRVFEGSCLKFPIIVPKFNELIHLRYIAFSAAEDFKIIPDSISKLWRLETIVVTTSSKTFEIEDISKLKYLRHLKTKSAIVLTVKEKKSSFGSLFSLVKKAATATNDKLQTLSRLSTRSCKDKVLSKIPNLKTLGIRGDLDSILDTACLVKLECVFQLKLIHETLSKKPWSHIPNSNFFPPHLKSLTLAGTNLDWIHMNTLGTLLNLEALKLKEFAFTGETWNFGGGGFHSLERLHIERLDLALWTVSENSFKELRYLVIKNCENLLNVPIALVRKLKTLEIESVARYAVISLNQLKNQLKKESEQNPGGFMEDFKLIIAPGDAM